MERRAVTGVGMSLDVSYSSPSSSSSPSLQREAGVFPDRGDCPCGVRSPCAFHSDRASWAVVPR